MDAMRHETGSFEEPGVLAPALPVDIGARSQRERILEAMVKSCAEKSFAGTTIADIVGTAGISRATFYKHFPNKRECFDAAANDFIDQLIQTASRAQGELSAGVDVVKAATEAILGELAARPEHARLLLLEAPIVDPAIVGRCREVVMGGLESQCTRNGASADPMIAFGRGQVLIADYVADDRAGELPALTPELVYIALLPFTGHEKALDHAKSER
jgi:AcrR family transcriptional regulator